MMTYKTRLSFNDLLGSLMQIAQRWSGGTSRCWIYRGASLVARSTTSFFALVGPTNPQDVTATVKGSSPAYQIQVTLTKGITFSTLAPITDAQSTVAVSPLNIFSCGPVEQTISITFAKDNPGNSSVQWTDVTDVLLGIDYAANVITL
jgi:hypothetical protein